ncbi:MAG: polysaccharide deacetylase family protein [Cyanobacteriota bacterium]|nr:polysaccharide deacetylase family protein [Cyanobacteriota bacterium]
MVQHSSLLRQQQQQQRVSRLALISAATSFLIGVMLPWNLRATREIEAPSISQSPSQIVVPNSESTQKPEEKSIAEATVDSVASEPAIAETPTQNQDSQVSPSAIDPKELPRVSQTITQRVEGVQAAITGLKAQRFESAIPESFKGKSIKAIDLKTDEKVVALTFDDGPWPKTTEQILEILKENDIKATFFWVGQALNNHKEIAKKVALDGHVIANHTWNHRYGYHSKSAAAKEIEETADLIEEVVGVQTPIFRPPGGVENNGLVDYVLAKDYVNIMWSSDSRDWMSSASSIIYNVLDTVKPGRIVLLHDGGGNRSATVTALPEIIAELKEDGYRFVTIPEMLEIADQQLAQQEAQQPE